MGLEGCLILGSENTGEGIAGEALCNEGPMSPLRGGDSGLMGAVAACSEGGGGGRSCSEGVPGCMDDVEDVDG